MSKPDPKILSWSHLFSSRKAVRKRYTSIWKIPVAKKVMDVFRKTIKEGSKLLDVGAFNRNFKKEIEKHYTHISYKSMDIDHTNFHDYYSMTDIQEEFDAVTFLECVEHLSLDDGAQTLFEIFRVLKPGGVLLISTPNTYHPNRYWECTHKVPFRYDEIGGLIEMAGFQVQSIYRIYNDNFVARILRLHVACYLHQLLNVDFAKSILLVAKKPLV